METKTFPVSGMKCVHCKANVENAIKELAGVSSAEANLDEGSVTVQYDATAVTPAQMKEAVENRGHYELTL